MWLGVEKDDINWTGVLAMSHCGMYRMWNIHCI